MSNIAQEQYVDLNAVAAELGVKTQRASQLVKLYVAAGQLPDRVVKTRARGRHLYPTSFVSELKRLHEERRALLHEQRKTQPFTSAPPPAVQTEMELHLDTGLVEMANQASVVAFLERVLKENQELLAQRKASVLRHN